MWQWSNERTVIEDATSATYTPVADDIDDTLTVTATYRDGSLAAEDDVITLTSADAADVVADTDNKAPVFPDQDMAMEGRQTDHERSVPENYATNETYVESPNTYTHPNIGAPVGAEADNTLAPGGAATADTLTYSLGGTDAASFGIVRSSGQLTMKAALDHEEKDTYMVTVTATDPGGLSATVNVTIEVTDVDEQPMIMVGGLSISGQASIDDFAEGGTGIVASYSVSGPNNASATWSLSGDDAGDFNISQGGMLTFANAPDFENPADADTDNVYMVTLEADEGIDSASHEVTVTVTNEAELGTLAGESSVEHAENGTTTVATYTADGPDDASWSLGGDDAGDFEISNGGVLTFVASPDFEAAVDADTDNVYMVTVMAEAGGEEDELAVAVTVTNVKEDGTVTISPANPSVGATTTATLVGDPDGGVTDLTWQWARQVGGVYTDIPGATSTTYVAVEADAGKHLQATATYTDGYGSDTAVATTPNAVTVGDPLVARYDADQNGEIDQPEVIAGINDYLFGEGDEALSQTEVIRLINLYLFGN